jgi:hypothetical protein
MNPIHIPLPSIEWRTPRTQTGQAEYPSVGVRAFARLGRVPAMPMVGPESGRTDPDQPAIQTLYDTEPPVNQLNCMSV